MVNSLRKILFCSFVFFASFAFAQEKSQEKFDYASPKQTAMSSFADIAEDLLTKVVNISITSNSSATQEFGSGFVISKDGLIITSNHVIEEASEILVQLNGAEKYKAKIIGIDKKTDLALLKIETGKDLKFSKIGDSNKSRVGDWVIVIGNPYGLGSSVSTGIISAKGRNLNNKQPEEFIQTDAAINNGNSGGPMFNLKGEVIGVSASILSPTGSSVGIGFAIPSNSVMQIIKQLKDQGEVVRGWIGVSVQDLSEEIAQSIKIEKNKGAFVNEVVSGSPADVAGILPTDIILKIDEQEVNEMKILPKIISKYPVGKIIKLTVFRRGKIKIIPVKVSKLREDEATKKIENVRPQEKKLNAKTNDQILGIGFAALNSSLKKANNIDSNVQGILITEISLKSEAASKGLILGDIILSINQIPISSVEEFKEAILNATKQSKKLYLFIKRGSNKFGLALNAK